MALFENHNCPDAPPRTPLGSFQTKQMLAENAKKREREIAGGNVARFGDWDNTETQTCDNVHGHRFTVPKEIYSERKYHDKLNKAKTLNEVEKNHS